jgi:chemotaxis signal transduction protein
VSAARPFRERAADDTGAQVIAFELGGELHACDVLLVDEVVTGQRVHPLPDLPPRILGMLRLRGELLPVIDVAPLLEQRLSAARPVVLVVETAAGQVGVAVDEVHDVVTLAPGSYRPAPGGGADARLAGVARVDGRLVTLVDLAEILREQTTLSSGNPS